MLVTVPILTFLKEHPQITTIKFCLDNDKPGRGGKCTKNSNGY